MARHTKPALRDEESLNVRDRELLQLTLELKTAEEIAPILNLEGSTNYEYRSKPYAQIASWGYRNPMEYALAKGLWVGRY